RDLDALFAPVVESMGYELVGTEFTTQGRRGVLRVYIDKEDGITVDDCGKVSYQLSGLLDVEDPVPGAYNLEVSSPGLDRPLFKAADYERFAGERVKIRLHAPMNGRRKQAGVLKGMEDDKVLLDTEDGAVSIALGDIKQARLVPDFNGS
ncbi:MAG: ribosome maturation factor RimP, partial [Gammaproteobacteria bacterium]